MKSLLAPILALLAITGSVAAEGSSGLGWTPPEFWARVGVFEDLEWKAGPIRDDDPVLVWSTQVSENLAVVMTADDGVYVSSLTFLVSAVAADIQEASAILKCLESAGMAMGSAFGQQPGTAEAISIWTRELPARRDDALREGRQMNQKELALQIEGGFQVTVAAPQQHLPYYLISGSAIIEPKQAHREPEATPRPEAK